MVEVTPLKNAIACLGAAERALKNDRTFAAEAMVGRAFAYLKQHNESLIDIDMVGRAFDYLKQHGDSAVGDE